MGYACGKTNPSNDAKANARSKHAPSYVANSSGTSNHVIPQAIRTSASADSFDTSTCLERVAATGKPLGAQTARFPSVS
jgi:hypothetical protein